MKKSEFGNWKKNRFEKVKDVSKAIRDELKKK